MKTNSNSGYKYCKILYETTMDIMDLNPQCTCLRKVQRHLVIQQLERSSVIRGGAEFKYSLPV